MHSAKKCPKLNPTPGMKRFSLSAFLHVPYNVIQKYKLVATRSIELNKKILSLL
jgi:hypothetical protein